MSKTHAASNGFQVILEARAAQLVEVLKRPKAFVIENSADQMDLIQCASEREIAIRNVDCEYRLLQDVKSALARMRDGSFGFCIDCEREISPRRLETVPWASRCVPCQEIVEQRGREALEPGINDLSLAG